MAKNSRKLPLADWQIEDSDRLKALFQQKKGELKLTQEMIASELGDGVTQGAVSHFMNRRTALSLKAAVVFAKMLKVPVSDFSPRLAEELKSMQIELEPTDYDQLSIVGSSAAKKAEQPAEPRAASPIPESRDLGTPNDRYALVPQYDAKAAAGLGSENPHVERRALLAFRRDWLKMRGANHKRLAVIYAEGKSMEPTISTGDVLLVDLSKIDPVDHQVFVLAGTDGVIVKRLISTPFGRWIIRSDNEDKDEYPDRNLSRDDNNEHRIIGQVIWRGGDL
ncbi:cI repressor protein [Pseudomonas citronellolis]|uniref:CI repressor protein n=1 Tax=Pseudomonas citronellolis TaxID=53408 RepID=A0A1A9KBS6_9PSED|nr:LexA family transcriptional regulator [Pseudomonas citronellolis]ANI14453.1 cI repressor protein [Pseudomonas citronellolis]